MHRNERFSTEYLQRIEALLQVLVPYVLNKYKDMPMETQELNKSLAYFLKVNRLNLIIATSIYFYFFCRNYYR